MALGELSDEGLPVSCETDVNGAVTMAMLQAVTLGKEACFLADLTIRHPQNDNAELLWHCGPFPYSLKDSSSVARLVQGQERFELKKGPITVCRFDDMDGKYYLFGGEGQRGRRTRNQRNLCVVRNEQLEDVGREADVWALYPSCGWNLRKLQKGAAGSRPLSGNDF